MKSRTNKTSDRLSASVNGQVTSGIWGLLSNASCYQMIQNLVGATEGRRKFIEEYVRPHRGACLLDIGCGPATILNFLPHVQYVGMDSSPIYINAAKKKFGDRGTFFCSEINAMKLDTFGPFDIVIATGVVHHLNDKEATQLFQHAHHSLRPGGRLLTFDPIYAANQSALGRWFIRNDRGKHIRDESQLMSLTENRFLKTTLFIRHDLFRIPYSIAILECFR